MALEHIAVYIIYLPIPANIRSEVILVARQQKSSFKEDEVESKAVGKKDSGFTPLRGTKKKRFSCTLEGI